MLIFFIKRPNDIECCNVKFGYSENATKLQKKNFHWVASNLKWKIFSNIVAFSEYLNFTYTFELKGWTNKIVNIDKIDIP